MGTAAVSDDLEHIVIQKNNQRRRSGTEMTLAAL